MRKLPVYYLNTKGTWIRTGSFNPSKPESHVEVVETAAFKKEIEALRKSLQYYEEQCDACNYSGIDEKEYQAAGCPSCDCLVAREALTRADKLIKELEDGN
jgi:hypothetical protein